MKNYYKKTTFTVLVLVNFILQITSFQAKAQYCVAPQYTLGSGCGYNFYMSDFQFAGISNTTTCSTIAPYYNYYSTMTATVEQNGGYSVSMSLPTISPYLAYFKMYIDYNDNNSFEDAGEEVYNSGNLANLTSVANGYVVIPVDAPLGTHRLRVRCADGDVNSCTDDGTIGEVEDYNITIQPQPLTANAGYSQYPSCSQSSITIGGFPSASGGTGPYTYSWSPSINLDDTTSSNPTLTVIPTTTYSASVTYTLTVTDANNNTASSIAFINLPYTSATANAGNDMSDCRQQLFGFEGTGSGTYFHWDFGDGGSADVQDATTYDYSYVAPGYYNAILTVTDYNGCAARDTIIVHAKGPDVDAGGGSYHYYSVCGTVVDFASATTNGESYYWAFGCDCVSNPNLNPVFDYQNYGSYVATLYATDNDGCENSSSATISLNEVPHANAGVDQTVCPGTRVFLGDDTSVGQMNWWEFGDGNTGYGLLTENTYAAVGTYYAVLSSGFDNTCGTSIDTAIITVAEPFVDFGGDRSVCGLTVDFIANAPSAISYSWTFSDGTTSTEANPSHTYDYYGTFSVTLSITTANGCTASTTANITLDQPPYANAGLNVTTCAGAQTILDGWYSNGITYSWGFGDGQTYVGGWNGTNIYANGGTYYATMTVSNQNACPDAVDTTVVTVHQPTADAGSDQTLCFNGGVISFVGTSTDATSYAWNFGDGYTDTLQNTTHTYPYASTFPVSFTAYNGSCSATSYFNAILDLPPYANAGADLTACAGVETTLNAYYSTGTSYTWNFGDGQSYNDWVGSNTYTNGGTYYATMTVSNQNSCPDAVDTTVVTVHQPTADAGSDQIVCFNGGVISFVGTSTDATSYAWNFGDGYTDTLQNTTHTYPYASTFPVSFTAYNGSCSAIAYFNATLDLPPVANAGLDVSACAGVETTFSAYYSNGATYSWNFGDGQSDNNWLGYNTYANGATYYATMTVSNQNSCPDAVDTTVVTVHQPTADAGSDQIVCFNGGVISFVGTSTDATSYAWNFGDGYTDTLQNTTHTYPYASTFPVSFTAYNGSCSATANFYAYVDAAPVADAGLDVTACAGVLTTLNAFYSTGTSYTWNFGDGQSYNDWVGSNTYTNGGTYYATMTVSNQNACPDAVDTTVVTVHQPTADAGADQTVCFNGGVISFVGTSTDATSYAWNFGDGYTDTLQNTTHTYPYASTFPVSFTAYNGTCSATSTFTANVNAPPVAYAGADLTGCAGVGTSFYGYGSNGTTYLFNFGDGNSDTYWYPTHTYNSGGTYYAIITVSNQNACPDAVDTAIVTIHQPTANVGPDLNLCLDGGVVAFNGTSTDATSYAWNFGDGNTDTLQNTSHTYTYPGGFPVSFTAYNGSCSAYSSFVATVSTPLVASAGPDVTGCAGVSVYLNGGGSSNGANYNWNFGDGNTGTSYGEANTYSAGGIYYATLTVSNLSGCPDVIDTAIVTIHQPTANVGPDQTVCFNGGVISFVGNASDATSYLWYFGDGNTDTLQNPSFNYTYAGTYNVTFNSYYGSCSATSSFTANVIAPNSGTQYLTICSGQNVVVGSSTYTTSGTFTDILTTINGCDSTVTTNLTVNPALSGAQTLTICAGTNISVGSNTYSASGTYNDILITTSGCDSVVTTILTVSPAITGTQSLTICDGATVAVGTNTYSTTGVYNDVLTAFEGCDSSLTTSLTVNPAITNSQSFTICAGNSVSVGSNTYTSSGTYVDVFVSSNECDSTVTTILTVNPLITNSQIITLCAGVSVTVGINMYNTSGTYSDTLSTSSGCDSIVTTNLTMLPSITGSQTLVLCSGSIVSVGTSSYTSSGVFTDILSAFNGCDSTVTTNLTINPIVVNSQSYNLCAGGSITVGSNTYSVSGVYTDVFTAFNGCDSTLTTNLSIGSSITGSQSLTVCPGGTVTVGTNIYSTNGIYVDTLAAFAGCDSIVTTNLTVVVQLAAASSSVSTCYGASQTLSVNGGSGTIYWSPALGLNTNVGNSVVASPLNTTMYYVTDTVGACQMIDSTLLTVNPLITADAGAHQSLCLGDTATFIANGTGGLGTYTYNWSDGANSYSTDTISIVPTSNLTFTLTITDAAVCSATDTVTFSSRHTDIYGLVTYSGGILSHGTNNKAVLYRWYNPNLAQFDTMQVSSIDTVSGYFHFTNVYNNNLLIKIFPDTSIYAHHFVPSYYNAANSPTSLWDSTTFFTHTCNAEDTLNIVMVENQTLSGSGHISGRLVQGPFFSPLANGMPRVQGDPIPGGDVKIGNNPGGQMIAATTTSSLDSPDGGGYYHFDSIPVGHYDIYIDIPGILRDSVWTIDITPTDTVYTNLDYWVDSSDIYPINPDINVQTPTIKGLESTFIVYPNPFRTNATIEYTVLHDAQVKLEVYSMIGDKINTLVSDNQQTGKYKLNLNTSNRKLSNGVYFIKLTVGNDSFTKRVVVIE